MYRSSIKKWQEQFMKPKGGRAMFSDWSYVTITPDEPIRPGLSTNVNYSLYDDYLDRVSHGNSGRHVPQPRHRKRRHRRTGEPNGSHSFTGGMTGSLLIDGAKETAEEMMKPVEEEDIPDLKTAEAEAEAINGTDTNDDQAETDEQNEADDQPVANDQNDSDDDDNNDGNTAGLYPDEDEDYYYYTYSDSEVES